ncbi:MAG: hydroxymethylbilane synthase [Caulobacteraceae bacterium]
MQPSPIRIGTRASRLAQVQARQVQASIVAALGADPENADAVAPLVLISTAGDRIQDRRLLEVGGKALFTKEIEQALLEGRIDCAVHSLKDVPADNTPGLAIAAYPLREDPRDAFVSFAHDSFEALPRGARLGTASLRRQAQALHRRPDLDIVMFRGNVETRLRKLEAGEVDACLLAVAGLNRLGLSDRVRQAFDPVAAPPAPGQGCIAIQTRDADVTQAWAMALHHAPSALLIAAERGALEALEGSCRTAMGAFARVDGQTLHLIVEALVPDGSARWRREASLPLAGDPAPEGAARALGLKLGLEVKAEGGDRLVWDRD